MIKHEGKYMTVADYVDDIDPVLNEDLDLFEEQEDEEEDCEDCF